MAPDASHPDAERLAGYTDGVLAVDLRADVEAHLSACADCRDVVAETTAFLAAEQRASGATTAFAPWARVVPFPSRRWTVGVVSGLAAALVLVVRSGGVFGPRGDRPELQALVAAVSNEPTRPVEGRLTGGFKYAPPPSPTRGPGDREVSPDVRIAAAKIEKLGQQQEAPEHDAATGVAYLVLGDLEKAIAALERAVGAHPVNAYFQSDLSAAYLARAVRNERAQDWPKALAAAERAIALKPMLVEPYFNRAVALTGLHLPQEARQALDDYLRAGGGAEWADEVRRGLPPPARPRR